MRGSGLERDGVRDLFGMGQGIEAVALVQVDVVQGKALQDRVARIEDVLSRQVPVPVSVRVEVVEGLGGHHDLIARQGARARATTRSDAPSP